MSRKKKAAVITVWDLPATTMSIGQKDMIGFTDMSNARTDSTHAEDNIKNWLRSRFALEFLGAWEVMYSPNFKVVEFDHFKGAADLHALVQRVHLIC